MKAITVDKLKFKKKLTNIEQITLKNYLFKWIKVRKSVSGYDINLLKYTEDAFAKMEIPAETNFLILDSLSLRYITLTEDNQIVIGYLNGEQELIHTILTLDEILNT